MATPTVPRFFPQCMPHSTLTPLALPDVIIKLDISNAFNVLCRRLTLDVLGGKASCDYACGLKRVTIWRLFVRSCATCLNNYGVEVTELSTNKQHSLSEYFKARCAPPNLTCVTSTFAGTYLTPGARPTDSKETLSRLSSFASAYITYADAPSPSITKMPAQ